MDVKTKSGVGVCIVEGKGSKILSFDRPVKAIELNREESTRLGVSLVKDVQTGVTGEVRKLINSGFLNEPKNFGKIKKELNNRGISVKPSSLNVILIKMVERKEIARLGQKRFYLYVKPHNPIF